MYRATDDTLKHENNHNQTINQYKHTFLQFFSFSFLLCLYFAFRILLIVTHFRLHLHLTQQGAICYSELYRHFCTIFHLGFSSSSQESALKKRNPYFDISCLFVENHVFAS